MFTVCPKCTLTLAVTAGDLRTGQGYVRCGRCSNVFNALLTLSEQPPEIAPSPPSTPASSPEDPKPAAAPASAPQPQSQSPPASEASSIQIDQILMLGGSAFPRSPAAAGQSGAAPAASRRSVSQPQTSASPLPPAEAPQQANLTRAPLRGPPAPKSSSNTASLTLADNLSGESEDVTDQFELPHRSGEPPAQRAAKAAARATPTKPVAPEKKEPTRRRIEEPLTAPVDDAELIERGGEEAFETRTVETIVLEGDGFTQTEGFVSEEQAGLAALRREIDNLGDERGMGAASPSSARVAGRMTTSSTARGRMHALRLPRRRSAGEASEMEDSDSPDTSADEAASAIPLAFGAQPLRYRWAWLSGSIALAVLLVLQALNHWRDALAASPSIGSVVTRTYAAFGVPLEPHWDLAAYEVRQQGAEADPKDAHVIHVRLSLANHAARAQPVPLLRLTLLDRYGKRIARRDLAPNEYWPRGRTHPNFMSADQRIDSEVAVRDPSADSASFELDVCLRGSERLRCAMDSAPATANILTP